MSYDAIVLGGGFYGTAIASYLANRRGFSKIAIIERAPKLLSRASYHNQARIHAGLHYPRSLVTAFRCQVNAPLFIRDYADAIKRDFVNVYAISRKNSKVTADQFKKFCRTIGIALKPPPPDIRALFNPRLISDVFLVEEHVFDAAKLAALIDNALSRADIEVKTGLNVNKIRAAADRSLIAECTAVKKSQSFEFSARYIFNCTYSGIRHIQGISSSEKTGLKHEIAEIALLSMPPHLAQFSATIMDGSFFSLMPFPARNLHSLTHVRYTPHLDWLDDEAINPYEKLAHYHKRSRAARMIRDAQRYMPAIMSAEYVQSLFEIKTILSRNEGDDGRPILFEKSSHLPNCYSVLGGKIDNVYDILKKLDMEPLDVSGSIKKRVSL